MGCMNVFYSPSPILSCFLSHKLSSFEWYCLGHPSISKLCQALPWCLFQLFQCELCGRGKHFLSTYHRLDSIPSKNIFDLVHCDVWGPERLLSILGFRYYLVLFLWLLSCLVGLPSQRLNQSARTCSPVLRRDFYTVLCYTQSTSINNDLRFVQMKHLNWKN